jgi:hypothetical protein
MHVGIREATRVDAEIRARARVGKIMATHADMRGRSPVVTDLRRSRGSTEGRIVVPRIAGREVSTARKALRTAESRAQAVGTLVLTARIARRTVGTVARSLRTTLPAMATRARMLGTRARPEQSARSVAPATRGLLASRAARQATSPLRRTVSKSDTLTV